MNSPTTANPDVIYGSESGLPTAAASSSPRPCPEAGDVFANALAA